MTPHVPHIVVWKRMTQIQCPPCDGTGLMDMPEKKSFRIDAWDDAESTRPDGEGWEIDEVYPDESTPKETK